MGREIRRVPVDDRIGEGGEGEMSGVLRIGPLVVAMDRHDGTDTYVVMIDDGLGVFRMVSQFDLPTPGDTRVTQEEA